MTQSQLAGGRPRTVAAEFRSDIEGMRAMALGLVFALHAGVEQLPGGFVGFDVFFVLSGFLLTGLLLREVEATGRLSLRGFYARCARRVLPAAGVVLTVTAVLSWLFISTEKWRVIGIDIASSALSVVNWRLADRSLDYVAGDATGSPVQHFWSLAVGGQFYLLWPLLVALLAWCVRRKPGMQVGPLMAVGALVVVIPSFVWSIHYTSTSPDQAFFVTPTRLWELGIGALIALGATAWQNLPRLAAGLLGWAGLAAIGASAFLFTPATGWPGSAALLPTAGTAAMIVAGSAAGTAGPGVLLSWRPAVWIGGLSYSLYLWHWPLLVVATAHWGELGAKKGLLVIAASLAPAYLCHRLIEKPIRSAKLLSRSTNISLSLGINFIALGAAAGLALVLLTPLTPTGASSVDVGAAGSRMLPTTDTAGTVENRLFSARLKPDPAHPDEDVPVAYSNGCHQTERDNKPIRCNYGDPDGDTTIVVVGDSKVLQYQVGLREIADQEGWHVISFTMSACGFHSGMQVRSGKPYTYCADWNRSLLPMVLDIDPDLVITSQRGPTALSDPTDASTLDAETMVAAIANRWQAFDDAGIPVAAIVDNPTPDLKVANCVAANPGDLEKCTFDRETGATLSAASAQRRAAERVDNTTLINLNDLICPGEQCQPVIGDVLVYRSGSHLTSTFVRTLIPRLRADLLDVLDTQSAGVPGR